MKWISLGVAPIAVARQPHDLPGRAGDRQRHRAGEAAVGIGADRPRRTGKRRQLAAEQILGRRRRRIRIGERRQRLRIERAGRRRIERVGILAAGARRGSVLRERRTQSGAEHKQNGKNGRERASHRQLSSTDFAPHCLPSPDTRRRGRGGDTLPLFARPVQLRRGRQVVAVELQQAAVRSPHAARSCRRSRIWPMVKPRAASARATNRQRWQSSGSRSAHIRQMRPGQPVRDSAPHRQRAVRAPLGNRPAAPSPHSRQRRRNRDRGFAAGRRARRRKADRSCLSRQQRLSRFLPENQGQKRDTGVERTSAIALTPAARSIATKRSAGMLEWPML